MDRNQDASTGKLSGSPMTVVLENRPDWLRDRLEQQLEATTDPNERQQLQQLIDILPDD